MYDNIELSTVAEEQLANGPRVGLTRRWLFPPLDWSGPSHYRRCSHFKLRVVSCAVLHFVGRVSKSDIVAPVGIEVIDHGRDHVHTPRAAAISGVTDLCVE
jgi:hypothetical protein